MADPLAITSLGMISSVGYDVAASCAAIRAGISRPRELPYYGVLDPDDQESVPLVGHPVRGYAEGFNIVGLWIRLGVGCLYDAIAYGGLPDGSDRRFWSATGLLAATPRVDDDRFGDHGGYTPEDLKGFYLTRLLEVAGLPIALERAEVICLGHAGALAAVGRARALIDAGRLERVIVLAVDSYLDPMTLDWLAASHRLKTVETSVGLLPGEAAAAFLVESPAAATRRKARVEALIHDPGLGTEPPDAVNGETRQGEALAAAALAALANAGVPLPFPGPLCSDLNGEHWRAYELGFARVRLADAIGPEAPFWFPCSSLGDVGAAGGAVGVCVAVRALVRRYAGAPALLVLASAEHGEVGAVCVAEPEANDRLAAGGPHGR